MKYELELVICTHNPRMDFLERTLQAIRSQNLSYDRWLLTIIDNASSDPLLARVDLSWHPNARIIREDKLGLTHARLRAIGESNSKYIVWSDDDNLLTQNYLTTSLAFMDSHPRVGLCGGKSIPEYEAIPPAWYEPSLAPLGCRDLGAEPIIIPALKHPPSYPPAAPIGAGMVSRRSALTTWANLVKTDPRRIALGRTGQALTSGEDNDMNLTAMRNGWDLAYVPQLSLTHLIPPSRLTLQYQKKMARASFRDFVTVLALHGIRPWPPAPSWSLPLRAFKSWVKCGGWKGPANSIRWHGVLGQYEGRSHLAKRGVEQ